MEGCNTFWGILFLKSICCILRVEAWGGFKEKKAIGYTVTRKFHFVLNDSSPLMLGDFPQRSGWVCYSPTSHSWKSQLFSIVKCRDSVQQGEHEMAQPPQTPGRLPKLKLILWDLRLQKGAISLSLGTWCNQIPCLLIDS